MAKQQSQGERVAIIGIVSLLAIAGFALVLFPLVSEQDEQAGLATEGLSTTTTTTSSETTAFPTLSLDRTSDGSARFLVNGRDLTEVWPTLNSEQQEALRNQVHGLVGVFDDIMNPDVKFILPPGFSLLAAPKVVDYGSWWSWDRSYYVWGPYIKPDPNKKPPTAAKKKYCDDFTNAATAALTMLANPKGEVTCSGIGGYGKHPKSNTYLGFTGHGSVLGIPGSTDHVADVGFKPNPGYAPNPPEDTLEKELKAICSDFNNGNVDSGKIRDLCEKSKILSFEVYVEKSIADDKSSSDPEHTRKEKVDEMLKPVEKYAKP